MVVRCGPCEEIANGPSSGNVRVIVARSSRHPQHFYNHHHLQHEKFNEKRMVRPLPTRPRNKNIGTQTEIEFFRHNSYNYASSSSLSSLWSKRFTRWWGWTWLRKRARTLNRIAHEAGYFIIYFL